MYVGIVQREQIQVKEGLLREYTEEYADKGESFPCEKPLDVDGRVHTQTFGLFCFHSELNKIRLSFCISQTYGVDIHRVFYN